MDISVNIPWPKLMKLATCRDAWRKRVRTLLATLPPTPTTTIMSAAGTTHTIDTTTASIAARTRSRCAHLSTTSDPSTATATTMTTRDKSQRTNTASSMATKYRTRDAHEAFFRPLSKSHRKQLQEKQKKESLKKKKKKKPKPLTDKQRAAAAREHYELHHTTWTPDIEGHHNNHNDNTLPSHSMDHTLLPPVQLEDMIQYIDNLPHDHENLQQLP